MSPYLQFLAIKGFIELLLMKFGDSLDSEAIPLIEQIRDGSNRLETLIRSIIKTAELETGVSLVKKSKNNIISLINECIEELDFFIKDRNHIVQAELFEQFNLIFDRIQIKEVFNNLLFNAIKYTPPNGTIKIKTESKQNINPIQYIIFEIVAWIVKSGNKNIIPKIIKKAPIMAKGNMKFILMA